jgi:hypothetical protein
MAKEKKPAVVVTKMAAEGFWVAGTGQWGPGAGRGQRGGGAGGGGDGTKKTPSLHRLGGIVLVFLRIG